MTLPEKINKLWNIKMMVIAIVEGVLGTVLKRSEMNLKEVEFRERFETVMTRASLRTVRKLRRVVEN